MEATKTTAVKTSADELRAYAKALRLSNLGSKGMDMIHRAQIEKTSYIDLILEILRAEVASRQRNDLLRRMRQAKLPLNCNLDSFDFNFSGGLTRPQLKQMRELVWLDQIYNIILMGPSGLGKTFIAAGLVRDAVLKGYKAMFITMEDLIKVLRLKEMSTSAMNTYNKIQKCNLVAIDDIMMLPMKREEAVAFFNLVNTLHEKSSLIITTNKAPTDWVEVLQDEVLATALLDRILFHCDVISLHGPSYRMENRSGFLKNTDKLSGNEKEK